MVTYRQPFRGEWPITQAYGEIVEGVTYNGKPHTGIDYGCPSGTEIVASADGSVMGLGESTTGYGKFVILLHGDGMATLYGHLSEIFVRMNQWVRQGDVIGLSGETGYATGPHLHFEARKRWNDFTSHFDPMELPLMSVMEKGSGIGDEDRGAWGQSHKGAVPGSGGEKEQSGAWGQSHKGAVPERLKGSEAFQEGEILKVTAPLGAKAFHNDGFDFYDPVPRGTAFYFTGKTTEHNGFTYMQVIPMQRPVWVAVHDGDCQILDRG